MSALTTLVLVDDDPATRDLWSRRLREQVGFRCAGLFADAESALPPLLEKPPDLLLADWQLPCMDGLTLISRVKAAHPHVRAVLITNHDLHELPLAAVRTGVDGCLLKPDSPAALPARLRAVMDGSCIYSRAIMRRLAEQFHAAPQLPVDAQALKARLTDREVDVLRAFASGMVAKQVADLLGISETTVKTHKLHIVTKLEVLNITQAVSRCASCLD